MFKEYPTDIDEMLNRLKRTADEFNLPFGKCKTTCNSRLAQEMGLWAEEQGAGDAFHMAAFKAYFVNGDNLFQENVLMGLAAEAGLNLEQAKDVLDSRRFKDAVDEDWTSVRERRVIAAPSFLMANDRLVGAQPPKLLENFVTMYGAQKRSN